MNHFKLPYIQNAKLRIKEISDRKILEENERILQKLLLVKHSETVADSVPAAKQPAPTSYQIYKRLEEKNISEENHRLLRRINNSTSSIHRYL